MHADPDDFEDPRASDSLDFAIKDQSYGPPVRTVVREQSRAVRRNRRLFAFSCVFLAVGVIALIIGLVSLSTPKTAPTVAHRGAKSSVSVTTIPKPLLTHCQELLSQKHLQKDRIYHCSGK
jgi:hypothetical protein